MALKPDDQYEYKICTVCGKRKKVHVGDELLFNHDEWIRDNSHLSEKYHGMCLKCTTEELDFSWRKASHERYEAEGKPIPDWIWKNR
jgi:hypothetical protein